MLFLHVRHDLVQGFVLGDKEIEDFALMFAPIQSAWQFWAILSTRPWNESISEGQLHEFEQCRGRLMWYCNHSLMYFVWLKLVRPSVLLSVLLSDWSKGLATACNQTHQFFGKSESRRINLLTLYFVQ